MISSKIASLEARIARLESSLKNKTATGWSPQSGAGFKFKYLFSIMEKTMSTRFGVEKTGTDSAKGWFDVGNSQYHPSMYKEFEPETEPFIIDWKFQLEQMPPLVGQFGDYASDYPEVVNCTLLLNGKVVGEEQIILGNTQSIVKQLQELDKTLALIHVKYKSY